MGADKLRRLKRESPSLVLEQVAVEFQQALALQLSVPLKTRQETKPVALVLLQVR
jgi:hypothetical protein